ncbi:ORC6 (YHR118C) [Zygosaccharomyces parabailii]|uniref:ZYBA0S12-00496g1_1 n=1 Tax=Zygosaccharomyces bailii (strain CLIB 213 / ATCC 58445 / CBS 680 / BCRC 21525 / NBRC 1098 / NCYC 1416 / NRRL Y-2227) TaxID=1333698 RepID=A0A8J2TAH1_ZYGB2|nr:ORC6 (YHR118C) [Zygosaccharomyces parabailii]CDF91507.1 ZYBA0S12-00496g1_1 [Zygosaccharomyces bailii CLIB 213]CDH11128.1 related to Origin recognition complex subunit 6 [Zygosaccharomyces bailii ISA1307]
MSNQQAQRCLKDVLGLDQEENLDWTQSHLQKLVNATSTLYTASSNKLMLKQGEETARGHLCAYIACERMTEKHMPELAYYLDRVPLEPRKARKLIELFKQNIFQCSPVKNLQWTPSPQKKSQSPIKNGDRFTAQDPQQLRKQLFDTPTKKNSLTVDPVKPLGIVGTGPQVQNSPVKARRKLAFEEDEDLQAPALTDLPNDRSAEISSLPSDRSNDSMEEAAKGKLRSRRNQPPQQQSPKNRKESNRGRAETSLLQKKYYKITTAELIDLCNQFEIPREVAYSILDQYMHYASYLVCPWQLACGLVLNATFVVFTERRRKDPRVDHLIFEKMLGIMKAPQVEDITDCVSLVKELIEGEKWYRDLQIKHDYYSGACFDEAISTKLGSMLQPNNTLVSKDQYANWRRKIEQDLSLRDMT